MKNKNIKQYSCLTENGRTELPNKDELRSIIEQGKEPELFLDSNACIHIIKAIDYKRKAKDVDIRRLVDLKKYISDNNININPLFGIMELSYSNGNFNESKFWDFKNRIDFFKRISYKNFKNFNFNYKTDYLIFSKPKLETVPVYYGLEPFILYTYCVLLKIRQISLQGLKKNQAEKNINELLDWMNNTLDIVLGVEYKLALNIFGGLTEFRKMIWLEGKPEFVKRKIMGSVWDITHSRFITNNLFLNKDLGRNIFIYFITSDENLSKLISNYEISTIIDNNKSYTSIHNTNIDYLHFEDAFIKKQDKRMLDLLYLRKNKKSVFNKEHVTNLIVELEKENNIE